MTSSSSITHPSFKYDVFVSFRGEDTLYGFTSHLQHALLGKGIEVHIDHDMHKGSEISQFLVAIEESRIFVVVFSNGYASSAWCLRELVHIIERKKKYGQVVIPVFYNVDPSEVTKQTGYFRDAFVLHEQRYEGSLVQRWREAMTEAAILSGHDSQLTKLESLLIEKLVEDIWKRLNRPQSWLGDNEFVDKIFMNKDFVTQQSIDIKDLFDGES